MPNIIFKKTFKIKGFQVGAEKSFSFHGTAVTPAMMARINLQLAANISPHKKANMIEFRENQDIGGHYFASMNHDFQKYHEEDAIATVLDVMESLGWTFRFQYDTGSESARVSGSSITVRELFLFHKPA